MKAFRAFGIWKVIAFLTTVLFFVSCCKYPPSVKTISAVAVSNSMVTVDGSVTANGGADVYSYGICFSADNPLPTISDTKKECSSTDGNSFFYFKASLSGIRVNFTYYFRAYAINSEGISYGEVISVKTLADPIIKNLSVSSIKISEATFNVTVNSSNLNSENWFEYGIVGQTTQKIAAGNSSGSSDVLVSVKVSDLTPGKTYSLIAKSKSGSGELSSNVITFETYSVSDYDGNLYHTVTIGAQTWLRENFAGTHFANGDAIPNISDRTEWTSQTSGAYCYYNNDPELGKIYGGLYNWYVATDSRGLIIGYKTPSNDDWDILREYSGGRYVAGASLKESGTSHWTESSSDVNNSSGFTALPGGLRSRGLFLYLNTETYYWSSTLFPMSSVAYTYYLISFGITFDNNGNYYYDGQSIRLVKN